jgi:hypothetical protein
MGFPLGLTFFWGWLLLAGGPLLAQMRFQGQLVYRIQAEGAYLKKVDNAFADTLRVWMREDHILTAFGGPHARHEWLGRMLIRADSGIVYKLLDSLRIAQRQHIELEASPYREFAQRNWVATPKTEKIASFECRRFTTQVYLPMTGGECQIDLWMWQDFDAPGAPLPVDLFPVLGGVPKLKGLVLKKRLQFPGLNLTLTQTCVSVKQMLLPESMFTIPADYTIGEYFPLDELPSRAPVPPKKKLDIEPFRLDKTSPLRRKKQLEPEPEISTETPVRQEGN